MLHKLPNAEFGVAEVARALKLSVIRAAKDAGLRTLSTNNEERNEPMRRLNESLGFRSIPGMIVYQGPLLL